ncbi:MAG: DUF1109 domain-containing protein [Alphaproteobacteria bacterium]|nr:DUF1109 domain-containing protein [Alphaproteobacteria bacterium]
MTDLSKVIDSLSEDSESFMPLRAPQNTLWRIYAFILLYSAIALLILLPRPEILLALQNPALVTELLLLMAIVGAGLRAAIYLGYPDAYQKRGVVVWPALMCLALVGIIMAELMGVMPEIAFPTPASTHLYACVLCIAVVSLVPSVLLFYLLKKAASTHPFTAGACIVLASTALGALLLRISEANDDMLHIVQWHYVPVFLFALCGAGIGKLLLRW